MPEYFDLSFLIARNTCKTSKIKTMLDQKVGLKEGKNNLAESNFSILVKHEVFLSIFDNSGYDFVELMIGFPRQVFHRAAFNEELESLCELVDFCFGFDGNIKYALCSYELNGYLLGGIVEWKTITRDLLLKFPIVFINKNLGIEVPGQTELDHSKYFVNEHAQDIF